MKGLKPLSGRIINNIIGGKRHGGKNDWDFDGVPNRRDCQPRNTMRQDDIPFGQRVFTFNNVDEGRIETIQGKDVEYELEIYGSGTVGNNLKISNLKKEQSVSLILSTHRGDAKVLWKRIR